MHVVKSAAFWSQIVPASPLSDVGGQILTPSEPQLPYLCSGTAMTSTSQGGFEE